MEERREEIRRRLREARERSGKDREESLLAAAKELEAAEVYNELGIYYKDETEEYPKALRMFSRASELQPGAAAPYNNQASCYVTMAQKFPEKRKENMQSAVRLFEKAGKLNSSAYFFLGNLYMPGINAPFPDDEEKAMGYFRKVDRDAGACWASALNKLGVYYYQKKKDYLYASACFALAARNGGKERQYRNNYEMAFSKVHNRKFWAEKFAALEDASQIGKTIEEGRKSLTPVCPFCGSTEIGRYSVAHNLRKSLLGGLGKKRYYSFYCRDCGREW